MKAVICTTPFEMQIGSWEKPSPGTDEVLVKVHAAGICAGDQYIYTGKNPYVQYPIVSGHEISGVVESVGQNVNTVNVGQAVAIEPFVGCGKCYPCRVGKSNCCANLNIIGVHRAGGYAEYVVAPAAKIFAVPDGMPVWKASMAEPITIAIHACKRGEVTASDSVLVMGCGPIGMNVIEVARIHGAKVYACDINPQRLEVAKYLGAEPILSDDKLEARVVEITNGEGMPVVIECAGVPAVMEQTVRLVASGGRVVIIGLVKQGIPLTFPGLDFTRKEFTIHGSRNEVGDFPEALDLLHSGKLKFSEMSTHLDMWKAPEIFASLAIKPDTYFKGILLVN
jgi:2-desacetyl-2-hydroxyethyl bacteriochlorophyllide A dehydrogenase